MAVDKVTGPIFANDAGTGGAASESAILIYEVTFDSATETAVDALTADEGGGGNSIPANGDAHPSDATLRVNTKSAVRVGRGYLFRVTVNYGSNSTTTSGDRGTSPLSRPTRWNEDPRTGTVEVDTQSDGKVLINSAKQTVTANIPYSDKSFTATRNVAARINYDSYFNTVNNAAFEGYAQKRVLLRGVRQAFTEETYEGEVIQYYQLTYFFELRIPRTSGDPSTWEWLILDEGNVRLDGTDQKVITDKRNIVRTTKTKLDGLGAPLAPGGTPNFLNNNPVAPSPGGTVDVYQTTDFSLLGL